MNNDILQKIKPKRLDNRNRCILFNDQVSILFGKSDVFMNGNLEINLNSPVDIGFKDLFDDNFESATSINKNRLVFYDNFFDIEVNTNDLLLFSVIAAIGEDLFLMSKVESYDNFSYITVLGLNFYFKIKLNKNYHINGCLDYHSFYYLFQSYKHLSGKKTDILRVYSDSDYIKLKCNDLNICIKQNRFNINYFDILEIAYNENNIEYKEFDKKSLLETSISLFKPISRLFGDIISISEKQYYHIYKNEYCIAYLNKVKD
ncbi:MAG: hypothetical protein RBR68_07355 [Tenuifilaceae bacterium]|jgi:hypothetical protein|nr:hypothetical protein [Tenuifilaceae bacterium]